MSRNGTKCWIKYFWNDISKTLTDFAFAWEKTLFSKSCLIKFFNKDVLLKWYFEWNKTILSSFSLFKAFSINIWVYLVNESIEIKPFFKRFKWLVICSFIILKAFLLTSICGWHWIEKKKLVKIAHFEINKINLKLNYIVTKNSGTLAQM